MNVDNNQILTCPIDNANIEQPRINPASDQLWISCAHHIHADVLPFHLFHLCHLTVMELTCWVFDLQNTTIKEFILDVVWAFGALLGLPYLTCQ